jgi:hypothetical protein
VTILSRQHVKSLVVPPELDLFCDVVMSPFYQDPKGWWRADLTVTRKSDGKVFHAALALDPKFPTRNRNEQAAYLQGGWQSLLANLKAQHEADPPTPAQ